MESSIHFFPKYTEIYIFKIAFKSNTVLYMLIETLSHVYIVNISTHSKKKNSTCSNMVIVNQMTGKTLMCIKSYMNNEHRSKSLSCLKLETITVIQKQESI
jgi:hypothetical protein